MSKPISVLVVTHTAQLGGAELALIRFCTALDPRQFEIRVICLERGDLVDLLREAYVTVEVVSGPAGWTQRSRESTASWWGLVGLAAGTLSQSLAVARRVRRVAPDLVQSWTIKSHLVTSLGRPLYRRPLVWYLHDLVTDGYLGRRNARILRLLSRCAEALIANSQATGRALGRPFVVGYPGVTPEQIRPRQELHLRPSPAEGQLLLLGRISPTKGQHLAIEALSLVKEKWAEATLRFVGAPVFDHTGYEVECRALAAERGLATRVEFAGASSDPRWDLDTAAVLIHASPTPEPFGQVVVEAMARGVPVIATEGGGVPELLGTDGDRFGVLVKMGSPESLAAGIMEVLERPDEAMDRAMRAYERAINHFTIAQTVDAVTGVWLGILGRGRENERLSGVP